MNFIVNLQELDDYMTIFDSDDSSLVISDFWMLKALLRIHLHGKEQSH